MDQLSIFSALSQNDKLELNTVTKHLKTFCVLFVLIRFVTYVELSFSSATYRQALLWTLLPTTSFSFYWCWVAGAPESPGNHKTSWILPFYLWRWAERWAPLSHNIFIFTLNLTRTRESYIQIKSFYWPIIKWSTRVFTSTVVWYSKLGRQDHHWVFV